MNPDPIQSSVAVDITLVVLILFLNGLISLSSAAMDLMSPRKIKQMIEDTGSDKAEPALRVLLEKPSRYRYCNRLLNYVLAIWGLWIIFNMEVSLSVYIRLAIYVAMILSLGEIFPRKLAKQHTITFARRLAGIQWFLSTILSPFTWVLMLIADIFLVLFRQKTNVEEAEFSEEDVMSMLEVGQQSGVLGEEGKKMIGSIFQFDDERAYEIMTPRTDVFLLDILDDPEEYVDQLMQLRYTRMPVCEGGSDNIIGILHIKDYLIKAKQEGFDNVDIKKILRKAYLVPETKKIDTLFFELQKEKQHIAILIDEYGGFSGIVTMEDIIEEIVGDIDDEYDEEEENIEKLNDGDYLIDGNVDLDDLNEEIGISLLSDTSETIGGFLIDLIGEIPNDGYVNQKITVDQYEFTILSVKERRIEKVKFHQLPVEEMGENTDETKEQEEK